MELLVKILEFCVENNCEFQFNPHYNEVEVDVRGLTTSWKSISVTFEVDDDCVENITLYRRDAGDVAEFLHDIPCNDIMTFLADVVSRYQL